MPYHLTHPYVRLPPRFLTALCVVSSFAVPSTQALDNIGGNNYGTIGPVMDYDPATGPGVGLIEAVPPLGIAAVSLTDSVAHVFTGEPGDMYELHGSSDGTNFTATGAMVRGDGGQQSAFDPTGTR